MSWPRRKASASPRSRPPRSSVHREDMTGDFGQLAGALQLRLLLAHERWEGSGVTPVQLINRILGAARGG